MTTPSGSTTTNREQAGRRHCMVVHAHYPLGETRVEREARALVERGYEVDVVCLQSKEEPACERIDGINVHRLPVERVLGKGLAFRFAEYAAFFFLALFKLAELHFQRHYRVVQVHNLPDGLVFVALIPKLAGARVILDLHDLMPEFYAARFNRRLTSWPVRVLVWQERISCWLADHVITVTEGWRETLIRRGLPAAKVSVVMNVADDRFFRPAAGDEPSSHDAGQFRLLYHGSLVYRYGIDMAIRAVGLARNSIPGLYLHVHGWGDARPALEKLTNELGLNDCVSFSTHALLTAELPGLIRQADVCLVPYRQDVFTDGILPTKLMEYAALGVPAIAARTTAIEAYFDNTMVEFFEPGNVEDLARCICSLYQDPQRLAELAQGGQKFSQRHTWTAVSADYVALVDRLRMR